jgi:predicted AAA+ superfamily ATPase
MAVSPDLDASRFYSSYVATYLQRDVHELAGIGDTGDFLAFLRIVAGHTGQLLKLDSLSNEQQRSIQAVEGEAAGVGGQRIIRHCVANAPRRALPKELYISYFGEVRATDATPRNIGTSLQLPP